MKNDIKTFSVIVFVIGVVIFRYIVAPKLAQDYNQENMLKLAGLISKELPFLKAVKAADFNDSIKLVFAVDKDYLNANSPEKVRDELDKKLLNPVCSLLISMKVSESYAINIVAGPNGGPMYDKYFSLKKCS